MFYLQYNTLISYIRIWQASIDFIIAGDGENEIDDTIFDWSDDEEDEKVENMVKLINEDHIFNSEMFVSGAIKADVIRMRKEAEEKNAKLKQKKLV